MNRRFSLVWVLGIGVWTNLAGPDTPPAACRAAEQRPDNPTYQSPYQPSAASEPTIAPAKAVGQDTPAEKPVGKRFSLPKLPWSKASSGTPENAARGDAHVKKLSSAEQQKFDGQIPIVRLIERRGQVKEAEEMYLTLTKRHPQLALPHHRLGVLLARRGAFAEADKELQTALRLDPKNPDLLNDAGYSCYLQGQLAPAEEFYRKGLAITSDHRGLCNNMGSLLAEQGRFEESLTMFRLVNTDAEAHSNLGFAMAQRGAYDQAQTQFSQALSLDSTLRPAALGLLQLADRKKQLKSAQPSPTDKQHALAGRPGPDARPADEYRPDTVSPTTNMRNIRLTSAEVPTASPQGIDRQDRPASPDSQPGAVARHPGVESQARERFAEDLTPRSRQASGSTGQQHPAPLPEMPDSGSTPGTDVRASYPYNNGSPQADRPQPQVPAAPALSPRTQLPFPGPQGNAGGPSPSAAKTRLAPADLRLSDRRNSPTQLSEQGTTPPNVPAAGGVPTVGRQPDWRGQSTQTLNMGLLNLNPHAQARPMTPDMQLPTARPDDPNSTVSPVAAEAAFPNVTTTWRGYTPEPVRR